MHHSGRHASQPAQGIRFVKIAQQWLNAAGTQLGTTTGSGSQRHQPDPSNHAAGHPQANVPAPHYQHALTAKTRWQGAKGALV